MTELETIYLQVNENEPKIKLTCIHHFHNILKLTKYLNALQDKYQLILQVEETVTDNLKLFTDGVKAPFYIVEFNESDDSFYLWKSEGKFIKDSIISSFYNTHLRTTKRIENPWETNFKDDSIYQTHPFKEKIKLVLNDLNVNWKSFDKQIFWDRLDRIIEKCHSDGNISFKSLILMALLKTRLIQNKSFLKNELLNYHTKMKSHISSEESILSSDDADYSTTSSSANSLLSTEERQRKFSDSDIHITEPMNNQLKEIFNEHFKLMVENYEFFELRTKNGIPKRTRTREPFKTKSCF
ncbi:hypothetical protein KAFR_0A03590 [Kazachstania africana CBS 2517]|uniref:Uncharacterized protein n=1 Tax=Kazachstania africana (strain ATCC 22294 / BCRC 22015 / CBS 2517 / CECT 1963 / NBRC 1671 / NRRL Y-8276) TaxID=1071382 RepID=H2AN44_KAZAF|nr:hypothetical protein KAFR_0A03590 [Kazachstania africana CBS 2517]CCF55794.1 hypothetical protein KAFR_0A03590 [Kazachstania africana CBS 2517]